MFIVLISILFDFNCSNSVCFQKYQAFPNYFSGGFGVDVLYNFGIFLVIGSLIPMSMVVKDWVVETETDIKVSYAIERYSRLDCHCV